MKTRAQGVSVNTDCGVDSSAPLVSVVIPVRDPSPAMLRRCLDSFERLSRAQSLQLVIVHTGAFDRDMSGERNRFHSCLVTECPTPGIYHAFNAGIDLAEGRFLLFYGHDDFALTQMDDALQLLAAFDDSRTVVACAVQVQGLGIRRPSWLRQGIVFRNWGHQGIFYSATALRPNAYDPRYPLRADHVLNIELLADASVRCIRLPMLVTYFSSGGFSSTTIADTQFDSRQADLAAEHFGRFWGCAVAVLLPVVRMLRSMLARMNRLIGTTAGRKPA